MRKIKSVYQQPFSLNGSNTGASIGLTAQHWQHDAVGPSTPTVARKAALLFGCHARNPSGPAVIDPHIKAGHMTAREPNQKIPQALLAPNGPSTHGIRRHPVKRTGLAG